MTAFRRYAIPGMFLFAILVFVYMLMRAGGPPTYESGLQSLATGSMEDLQFLDDAPPLPNGDLLGPDGETVQLANYKGKVLVVNLWATWCAPCIAEMPTLAKLDALLDKEAAMVIPVSIDQTGYVPEAKRLLASYSKDGLPFFHDAAFGMITGIRAGGVPLTVIYDRSGVEVARYEGSTEWDTPEAVAFIEAVAGDAG